MRAQKDSPQTDAVIFDLSVAKIAKEEGLIAEIDASKIPNYADLADIGKELGGYAPPLTYDTLALLYKTLKPFPKSPPAGKLFGMKSRMAKSLSLRRAAAIFRPFS
jgi:putative spermidine/putrescine transport system substrate-binding protein